MKIAPAPRIATAVIPIATSAARPWRRSAISLLCRRSGESHQLGDARVGNVKADQGRNQRQEFDVSDRDQDAGNDQGDRPDGAPAWALRGGGNDLPGATQLSADIDRAQQRRGRCGDYGTAHGNEDQRRFEVADEGVPDARRRVATGAAVDRGQQDCLNRVQHDQGEHRSERDRRADHNPGVPSVGREPRGTGAAGKRDEQEAAAAASGSSPRPRPPRQAASAVRRRLARGPAAPGSSWRAWDRAPQGCRARLRRCPRASG